MRMILVSVFGASLALYSAGCTIHTAGGVGVDVETPSVQVDTPVFEGPGVVQIDVDPPIAERQYVYDEGFPPGVYLYGGFYYYNGYRYDHDVFVNRFVQENIRNHRYVNVEENRRLGRQVEEKQKVEYQRTGGKHVPKNGRPAEHKDVNHPETPAQNHERTEHPEKPAEHHVNTPEHHEGVTDHPAKEETHGKETKPEKHEVKPENHKPAEKPAKPEPKEEKKEEK